MKTREGMSRRDKSHDWAWQDAFTPWRDVVCYLQTAGRVRWNKRRHNHWVRQEAKREIRRGEW